MINQFKPGKKRCKNCGGLFYKSQNNPFENCCCIKCKIERKNKLADKRTNSKPKQSVEVKKPKEPNRSNLLARLQDEINAIAKIIDYGQPCISCNSFEEPQAGHYHSVGSDETIRYNLHDIHIQDHYCNIEKSDNRKGYDIGLKKNYGNDYFEYVKFGLKKLYTDPIKLSIIQLKECIISAKVIKQKLNNIKIDWPPFQRMLLRDEINETIGIYNKKFLK